MSFVQANFQIRGNVYRTPGLNFYRFIRHSLHIYGFSIFNTSKVWSWSCRLLLICESSENHGPVPARVICHGGVFKRESVIHPLLTPRLNLVSTHCRLSSTCPFPTRLAQSLIKLNHFNSIFLVDCGPLWVCIWTFPFSPLSIHQISSPIEECSPIKTAKDRNARVCGVYHLLYRWRHRER